MKIRNLSSVALEIAASGQIVEAGDSVEVDDALGKALCEQVDVWHAVKKTASKSKED